MFCYFFKGGRGHELFKNLLRGEGKGLISLFWEKKLLKNGNRRWGGCEFVFQGSIVDGGEGPGLYFFTFKIFMFVNFWGLLLIKEGGKWGMAFFY